MGVNIGWFTTGRDIEAVNLLNIVYHGIKEGRIDGRISYLFLNREKGEGPFSDTIIDMGKEWRIPVVCVSSSRFMPEFRRKAHGCHDTMAEWREKYHLEVMRRLEVYEAGFSVLAGYMLIAGPSMCMRLNLINLHPALPHGPSGTWQEVVWQLIDKRADESGVMIHKVTKELDKGPAIAYCSFRIGAGRFPDLWRDMDEKLDRLTLKQIISIEGEKNALFQAIRQEGVKREIPLLFETIRCLSCGRFKIEGDSVYIDGIESRGGVCMNEEVERIIGQNR
ncbi:hypothetical protein JXL19_11395 [bacterium]|nr:hypothetical protein [bacterium]